MTQDVAVVIPAFNAADLLPAALGSLQQQTLEPAEVVVVDEASFGFGQQRRVGH